MRKPTYREEQGADGDRPRERRAGPNIELKTALEPIHRKLRTWQSKSVWIAAMLDAKNHVEGRVRMDAEVLLGEVRRAQDAVAEIEAKVPGAAGSSLISDTLVALRGIESAMQSVGDRGSRRINRSLKIDP